MRAWSISEVTGREADEKPVQKEPARQEERGLSWRSCEEPMSEQLCCILLTGQEQGGRGGHWRSSGQEPVL